MGEDEDRKVDLNKVVENYGGAIIGGLVALLLCFTKLYKILIAVIVVLVGGFIGNYIQKNKTLVKEKLKAFIDKF